MEGKKIKFGILSTAEIANKICYAIHDASNAEVVAVASRSLEKAEKWGKERNVPKAYGTYDELLKDSSIDVIYIPLPTALKKEWTIKSLEAGKHVLVEKALPGTDDVKDLEEMIAASKKANKQLMDGTMWLHSIRTLELEKVLASGEIGDVVKVNAALTFKAPSEEWYEGGNGRTDLKREPLGCLGDNGWYPIGAIMWGFKYEQPVKAQMHLTKFNKMGTIVAGNGSIWFKDSRIGNFEFGVDCAHRSVFEVVGTNGALRVEDQVGGQGRSGEFNAYFENFVGSGEYKKDDVNGKEEIVKVETCNHTVKMIEALSKLVLEGKTDDDWPNRSLACQKVLAAVYKSAMNDGKAFEI